MASFKLRFSAISLSRGLLINFIVYIYSLDSSLCSILHGRIDDVLEVGLSLAYRQNQLLKPLVRSTGYVRCCIPRFIIWLYTCIVKGFIEKVLNGITDQRANKLHIKVAMKKLFKIQNSLQRKKNTYFALRSYVIRKRFKLWRFKETSLDNPNYLIAF